MYDKLWGVERCTKCSLILLPSVYEPRVLSHECPDFDCKAIRILSEASDNEDVWGSGGVSVCTLQVG